ncbi:MAG: hypothetical protein MUE41_02815 [Gemmatimonadaceae bacterium]|nr:hypothetical protein [Gemmatimonadaceae bacterium]
MNVSYTTANGNSAAFFSGLPGGGATRQIFGIPAAQQQANEFHFVTILAASNLNDFSSNFRGQFTYFRTLADRTVTLAGNLASPNVSSVAGGANGRVRITGTLNAPYTSSLTGSFTQTEGTATRGVSIFATSGYLGGAAYDLTIPDFSGVAGWQEAYGLLRGTRADYTVTAAGFTGAGFDLRPAEGAVVSIGGRGGNVTP